MATKEEHLQASIEEAAQKVPTLKKAVIDRVGLTLEENSGKELSKSEIREISNNLIEIQLQEME